MKRLENPKRLLLLLSLFDHLKLNIMKPINRQNILKIVVCCVHHRTPKPRLGCDGQKLKHTFRTINQIKIVQGIFKYRLQAKIVFFDIEIIEK